jgi:hypothetical protein
MLHKPHWRFADHRGTIRDLADNDGHGNLVSSCHGDFNAFGKIASGTPMPRFPNNERLDLFTQDIAWTG